MTPVLYIVGVMASLAIGAGLSTVFTSGKRRENREKEAEEARTTVERARREAESITNNARLAANEQALKVREQVEQSLSARQSECAERERRLGERETLLNSQLSRMMESETQLKRQQELLDQKISGLDATRQELAELTRQRREQLHNITGINAEEAKEAFLKEIRQESQNEASNITRRILEDAKHHADEKARNIIATAVHRHAGELTSETSTAAIALHGDEIKGRIIGREGRNIRAFENATGVTVLIDDTPGTVILSAFDPVRREIAREAMSRLIEDGRIHPTRIEEVVAKVTGEMDETIVRVGEEAVARAGLPPMDPEIVKLLGKLHFRRSYSQNILSHSVEVAQLMGLMAAEMGVDVTAAKRAGLLHDIGKAVNHEIEGPHAVVGAEIIRRHGESEAVVNGVASHHNDVPPVGPLGVLVSAADAISASRPGARSESMTTYVKRVEDLEKIGLSFPGVERCYAVQAGRELRVFVQPQKIGDQEAFTLARSIASKIESDLQYPGQIRVTVVRETRCVEVAK
jgi:ribonuclease Y